MSTEDRKQRITSAWQAAWDEGRVDVLDSLLGKDYVRHGRSGDQDREAFKASISATRNAFPDLVTTIAHLIAEDDLIAVRWRSTGTHLGSFEDVPATRRAISAEGVTIARFDGAVIAEEWVTWDPVDLLTSLGILSLREFS